jgi:hypothetical protein
MIRRALVSLIVVLGVACSGGTSTPPPSPAASARPAAEQAYVAVLDKHWQAYSDAYAKPPCSRWDSNGLPVQFDECLQGSQDYLRVAQAFLDDLNGASVPARMATQHGDLKGALQKTVNSLVGAIKALNDKNGPAFDSIAEDISNAFNSARAAYRELTKP